jgi:predicted nucleic acid-binding protein
MFLATSGLLCYHHADEPRHGDAQTLFEASGAKLTHGYVLAEFVALAYARGFPRREALAFLTALLEHPEVEVIWADEALHREAMRLLEARLDKAYSLCDAVSLVLMRKRRLHEALTTDHHFEQEGFRRLLSPS